MSPVHLVQVGMAAQRWHAANLARRAAGRQHRLAREAADRQPVGVHGWLQAREIAREAEMAHTLAKVRERAARRALEKLCARRAGAINVDMLDVREVMEGQL